ncbi:hypothetical protein BMS3Bbin04_01298 [bacterium BMS3Bbin04]|nr:hypothetical protein BMS3Bbin04_01298 [bacterium BMS3Bbin04]
MKCGEGLCCPPNVRDYTSVSAQTISCNHATTPGIAVLNGHLGMQLKFISGIGPPMPYAYCGEGIVGKPKPRVVDDRGEGIVETGERAANGRFAKIQREL